MKNPKTITICSNVYYTLFKNFKNIYVLVISKYLNTGLLTYLL
jgi:predicted CopG family antitoxin